MSNEDEYEEIRRKRMEQLKAQYEQGNDQQRMQDIQRQKQQQFEMQKAMILQQVLDSDARVRLNTLKMARPQFAESIEMQLVQLHQSGRLQGQIPLTDAQFKDILKRIQSQNRKRDINIKFK